MAVGTRSRGRTTARKTYGNRSASPSPRGRSTSTSEKPARPAQKRRTSRKKTNNAATVGKPLEQALDVTTQGRRTRDVLTLAALVLSPAFFVLFFVLKDSKEKESILASTALSTVGFFATVSIIPVVARANARKNLFGRDINKRGTPAGEVPIPESLGLATGLVHIVCIVLFQQIHTYFLREVVGGGGQGLGGWTLTRFLSPKQVLGSLGLGMSSECGQGLPALDDWTEKWLIQYNSALASISLMVFLGFADDVLDIPWRTKLFLPSIATLPILAAYTGSTAILIPKPLRPILGASLLELGFLYKVFILLVVVFCTNSINILAGLNGLEAGQTLIISAAVILFNLLRLSKIVLLPELSVEDVRIRDAQLFSVYITLPLIAVTTALLLFNYYPSRVFVGDTYTYFAGMALAVSGILGHFSETLLIFFIPQIINFLYSCPQLFKVVPCPRHRLPVYEKETGLLFPSKRSDGGYNLNLVTLFLRLFGPCTEKQLCNRILFFQVVCCALGFAIRHVLEGIYK
jgi:UDP-N-acetylglucosamine--dolichyl-phosphate N-acetylglucosaminephosphotransferase